MTYTKWLENKGVKFEQLSKGVKELISSHNEVETVIKDTEAKLVADGLPDAKKKKLETALEDAQASLAELEDLILPALDKWYLNREKNAEKGKMLLASRTAKKAGHGQEPVVKPELAIAGSTATASSTQEPAPAPGTKPEKVEKAAQAGKAPAKASSGRINWYMAIGIVLTLVTGVAVVGYYNNKSNAL